MAVLLIVISEVILRGFFFIKKIEVGSLKPNWSAFQPVDSLENNPQFFTDSIGLYKAVSDYWEVQQVEINEEGFRGRSFKEERDSNKTQILFIGDSFTWGAKAEPLSECFVDLLNKNMEWQCYNAGIPGTDPAQYLALAQKYIPALQPDVVVVNLYLANDLMEDYREIIPNQDLYYQTNAGWLPAYYENKYFSTARESYDFATNRYVVKGAVKWFAKSAIGTAILSFPLRLKEYQTWQRKKKGIVTNSYLKKIDSLCVAQDVPLEIFIIPAAHQDLSTEFREHPELAIQEAYNHLMDNLKHTMFVLPMKKHHYLPLPDGHFNNEGHRFAAELMEAEITNLINRKVP